MMHYYLGIDIGASSGRHILGHIEDNKIILEEIHRFKNAMILRNHHYCWDIDYLFQQIIIGMKKCKELNKIPKSVGIDTWAIDFVLLDHQGKRINDCVAYRDKRTLGILDNILKEIRKDMIYQNTGIQFLEFNTIYQLIALKKSDPEIVSKANDFLMIPDYFNYLLTGKKANEYTNATTTQLLNVKNDNWDKELLNIVGIKDSIFQKIMMPGNILGRLKAEMVADIGFDLDVVLPATHDTGSAYVSAIKEGSIIISSGTWSLLGVELETAKCSKEALDYNFSNEGGINRRYRFLKNIMGLWMIQEVQRLWPRRLSFSELVNEARKSEYFDSFIDVNDDCFLNPDNMIQEIQNYCVKRNRKKPETIGEIAYCIYNSLADYYKKAIDELEYLTKQSYACINIIGGGCQNELLNQLIAKKTGKKVYAGPIEATAIGNIVIQMIADGSLKDLKQARNAIKQSFEIKCYEGENYE